ncbi:unnamed protein product, partial [Didymodactylos carnosus]
GFPRLRERKLEPGYFLKLHHGQLVSSQNNINESYPCMTTSSARLQDRLRIRFCCSLQHFLAARLKPGRRGAKEHAHRIRLTVNEYNYFKSIGIKSQFTPQISFFASLNCIVNLVYGEYKDKVCYVSDFHCKVCKSVDAKGLVVTNTPACDAEIARVVKEKDWNGLFIGYGVRHDQQWFDRIINVVNQSNPKHAECLNPRVSA